MMADEPGDSFATADGIWRPESWRGRWLVVRLVRASDTSSRREVDSSSPFSATVNIYEDEDNALARCNQLNNEETTDEQ